MIDRGRPVLLHVAFAAFTAAALVLAGATVTGTMNLLGLPIVGAVVLLAMGLGAVVLLRAGDGAVVALAALALVVIDLGTPFLPAAALAIKGLAYALCFVLGVQHLLRRHPALGGTGWLWLAYALSAWASTAYSHDRWTSAYTGFALAALVGVALRLRALDADRAWQGVQAAAAGFGVVLVVSLVLYVVAPQLVVATQVAGSGRVSGLYGSPNSAGAVAAMAWLLNLALALWSRGGGWRPRALALLFGGAALGVLVLSGSRNAGASAAAATLLLLGLKFRRVAVLAVVLALLAALALTVADAWRSLADTVIGLASRTGTGFDVRNLTGRTEIWAFAWAEWQREPLFGHGLGASRRVIAEGWANFWGKTTGTAHNVVLESLLDLGLVGSVLLAAGVAALVRETLRARHLPAGARALAGSLLAFVGLFGVAEKSFAGTPSTATGALLLVAALVAPRPPRAPA